MVAASTRWSIYAGSAAFIAGAVAVGSLGAIARTLSTVLGLPTGDAAILLPAPGAVLGGVVWWAVVERRAAVDYPSGAAAGCLTAVLTVGVWTLLVALVYGPGVIFVGETLLVIAIAVVVTTPFGAVMGVAVTAARRLGRVDPADSSSGVE
ncbi:hypothetical protein [Halohasta salina]|uniref:hypothetical protein n=1 Tax=Halohasta salina TaxID=2961621 RepID=UPI0020A4DB19|nr:hypothetical protein [Halohasta salina]